MFSKLKRFFYTVLILSVSTFVQINWSMGYLADRVSSADLELGFLEESIYMSLVSGLFVGMLFFVIAYIRNIYIQLSLQGILLVSVWLFWNHTIFVDRESSWSTYLFREEMYYVVQTSFFPILIVSIVALLCTSYATKLNVLSERKLRH